MMDYIYAEAAPHGWSDRDVTSGSQPSLPVTQDSQTVIAWALGGDSKISHDRLCC